MKKTLTTTKKLLKRDLPVGIITTLAESHLVKVYKDYTFNVNIYNVVLGRGTAVVTLKLKDGVIEGYHIETKDLSESEMLFVEELVQSTIEFVKATFFN